MPYKTLADLVANSEIQANTVSTLSQVVEITVPRGKFFYFTKGPQVFRPGGYEIQDHTVTAAEIAAGEFTTAALTDQPCKPPSHLLPDWPDQDGYTFKVYLRYNPDGGSPGAWTRATINGVDWANKTLDIALPTTLPDADGNDHTLADADPIQVRISYALSSGSLLLRRETPVSAQQSSALTVWEASPYSLNVRDQFHTSGRWTFGKTIWAPEKCRITLWANLPVTLDIDPDKSVTLINWEYVLEELARAEARYREWHVLTGKPLVFRTLYQRYLAELAQIADEPLAI